MSFIYDKDLLETECANYRLNPIEKLEELEAGKNYRMTVRDIDKLFDQDGFRKALFDFVYESTELRIYCVFSLQIIIDFMKKYPFMGICFSVKEKEEANDEFLLPKYTIKVLQFDEVVEFWSEKIEDWMEFRKDINEVFIDFSYIQLHWGKSKDHPSSVLIQTDEFCRF